MVPLRMVDTRVFMRADEKQEKGRKMKRFGIKHPVALVALLFFAFGGEARGATGLFSLGNGYFSIAGDNGMVTSLRLDATGAGNYGSNTIADSGHMAFVIGGELLTSPAAAWTVSGSSLTITGLPNATSVSIALSGAQMTANASFSGSRTVQHEWDLAYLDDGFYQRATGSNYNPDVAIDIPFVDFYSTANGSFRTVEMLKRTAGMTGLGELSDPRIANWSGLHCRGRGNNSVMVSCKHGSETLLFTQFEPQSDRLTLKHGSSSASYMGFPITTTLTITVEPKDFSVTLDGNRPLPEFYVEPVQVVSALSDPSVTGNTSDLLSQFYHHMTYWWGPQGHSGGIWTDWAAMAGIFQDTPFRESVEASIFGWTVGDDGYGNDDYAYTWGAAPGWPFPEGRDTRHFNTNSQLIDALWRYIMWTGDTNSLTHVENPDRAISITYQSTGSTGWFPSWNWPAALGTGTYGQSFTATESFTAVSALSVNWGTTGSGCTMTLYDAPGGTALASQNFSNTANNSGLELVFSAKPAGSYYLEMSDAVGTIGWWSQTQDLYAGGRAYIDGETNISMAEKMRNLMTYQQTVLLAASNDQIVTGPNIGSNDHGGRHNLDVGGNYYDILPFGYHDAMTDLSYYQSVRALADLEEMVGNPSAATQWRARMARTREKFNQTYWRTGLDRNADEARYIGCVDINGVDHDYGFTFINTMAITAGLTQSRPDRVAAIFDWLDNGEAHHSPAYPAKRIRIGYDSGPARYNAEPDAPHTPIQLTGTLEQEFFADAPFSSVASHNPTWTSTTSDFTLTLLRAGTGETVATLGVVDAVDNAFNEMTFSSQPAGYYILRIGNPNGTVGWWASEWSNTLYDRWVMPRTSTLDNQGWWQAAVGGDPTDPNFNFRWDIQLQNGGASLYESGFDIWARARWYDADSAWERMERLLQRWLDPDRMSGNASFYGHDIQGGGTAGSIGWCWSEFPETGVLGAAFFNGFFGVEPSARGLRFQPAIPTGHGITTIGARNISYFGALFDIEATTDSITFTCTRNPAGRTFYMTGGYSNTGTFTRTVPLDHGAAILSYRPQAGIEELTVDFAFSGSNETLDMAATFDGAAMADYVLQTCDNLVSGIWNTIEVPFTADTNFVTATTNNIGFFRVIGE